MKNIIQFCFGIFLFGTIATTAQISTSTGGGNNVLPNASSTNTNVGIGTNNPTAKLEVVGDVKVTQGFFTNSMPNGSVFSSSSERNDKCLVFAAGSLLGSGSGYLNTRMFHFYDFPQSNYNSKPQLYFSIEDRANMKRFLVQAETGGYTQMTVWNKSQQQLFRVFEDGNDKVYLDMPKPNSRIVIAGFGDYLPEHKFVVRGSSKIEGNILTDSNIGIGDSSFTDGAVTYRLSVKGKVRAEEIKVYSSWADYVFKNDYKLPDLKEVETYIKENGHLQNVPSAKEIIEKGLVLGEMSKIQQEKIEELTLYLIQQNKEIDALKSENGKILKMQKEFEISMIERFKSLQAEIIRLQSKNSN
jgi:hypothetical protein